MLRGPTTAGHYDRPRLHAIHFSLPRVHHGNELRLPGLSLVFHTGHGRADSNAHGLPWLIQRGEVDGIPVNRLDRSRTGNRMGNQGLHNMAADTVIPARKRELVLSGAAIHGS